MFEKKKNWWEIPCGAYLGSVCLALDCRALFLMSEISNSPIIIIIIIIHAYCFSLKLATSYSLSLNNIRSIDC